MSARPRLLYVASRWPYPVTSGRMRMIAQVLEAAARTHEVHLLAFSPTESVGEAPGHVAGASTIPRPSIPGVMADVLANPTAPLQGHLFVDAAARRAVGEAVDRIEPDVVVLDMIRLFGLAPVVRKRRPSARLVLDMDDLLSERYAGADVEGADILGAFSASMPSFVRGMARSVPNLLMKLEGALVAKAEEKAAEEADAVLLVSRNEAGRLLGRVGNPRGPILDFPPSVAESRPVRRDFSKGVRFVFLGDEAYAPNAKALLEFDGIARSFAGTSPPRPVAFEAAGRKDERLETPGLVRHGFVPDLDAYLGRDAVMVAPMRSGSGIKTKLLDALSRGVPVVTTPKGREGLDLEPGREIFILESRDEFEAFVSEAASGRMDGELDRVGAAGAAKVAKSHDPRRLARNLAVALGGVS